MNGMKKMLISVGITLLALLPVVLALPLVSLPHAMILSDFISNILVTDHSAEWRGQNTIYWNGSYYDTCTGVYNGGKTIAKTTDSSWDINEVEEDPSHTFLVIDSFLDQYLLVKRGYTRPPGATVTAALIHREEITEKGFTRTIENIADETFCRAVDEISVNVARSLTYESPTGERLPAGMEVLCSISMTYENCPLATATVPVVEIGILDRQWIVITQHSSEYGIIPDEYIEILESYLT